MNVVKFTNKVLSSNSYIIHSDSEKHVWVLDPGDTEQILAWINTQKKTVKGILLTHSHFDHIYGVNNICETFPELIIYSSEFAREGLKSPKANYSYYMEMPYTVELDKIINISDGFEIDLLFKNIIARVLYTPGHNIDCVSYRIENYIFTGDALIPGIKVHIRPKQGSKKEANNSIKKILSVSNADTLICPGHGETNKLSTINKDIIYFPNC